MKRYFYYVTIASCLSGLWTPSFAKEDQLPDGWRLPSKEELKDSWRNASPNRNSSVVGDFDGDKTTDKAKILVNAKGDKMGIFVWLGRNISRPVLALEDKIGMIDRMGIDLYKPGKYKTACGKGYMECDKGEPEELLLTHDAIDYFKTESANSCLHWDSGSKKFKRTWMSD